MARRQIKVYKGSTKKYAPVPKITLQGHWIKELGFSIGDRLTVTCDENQINIFKCTDDHTIEKSGMVAEQAGKYGRRK